MFEIRFVALPGGLLPSLFKPRCQNGLTPGAPGFEAQKYIGNMEKKLLVQNNLAQMLENWYRGLHS